MVKDSCRSCFPDFAPSPGGDPMAQRLSKGRLKKLPISQRTERRRLFVFWGTYGRREEIEKGFEPLFSRKTWMSRLISRNSSTVLFAVDRGPRPPRPTACVRLSEEATPRPGDRATTWAFAVSATQNDRSLIEAERAHVLHVKASWSSREIPWPTAFWRILWFR